MLARIIVLVSMELDVLGTAISWDAIIWLGLDLGLYKPQV